MSFGLRSITQSVRDLERRVPAASFMESACDASQSRGLTPVKKKVHGFLRGSILRALLLGEVVRTVAPISIARVEAFAAALIALRSQKQMTSTRKGQA